MLKASEARILVEKYEDNKKTEMMNAVKHYCNTVVQEEINLRASDGRDHTRISVPTVLDLPMVMQYLKDAEYVVTKLTASYIYIEWSKKGE